MASILVPLRTRLRWMVWQVKDRLTRDPDSLCCPVCRGVNVTSRHRRWIAQCIFGGGRIVRHQCPECDLIFGSQRVLGMNADALQREYEEFYARYNEVDSTESELRVFDVIKPHSSGTYLNYGSGRWSKSIPTLRSRGLNVFGYEPYLQNNVDAPEYIIRDAATLASMKFDAIISHNVVEHMQDPVRFLQDLSRLLKPSGMMAHASPCYEYCYEYTRLHTVFFTGRSCGVWIRNAGLTMGSRVDLPGGQIVQIMHAADAPHPS